MSNDVDVMTGLAQLLDDAGVGTYRPSGTYAADETAIVFVKMPAAPDRCICITAYTYANWPDEPEDQQRIQIRCRGARNDMLDASRLRGAVYDQVHGLTNRNFGSVHATQILQQSSVPMGVDDSDRNEFADNYTADVDVPATANRPT